MINVYILVPAVLLAGAFGFRRDISAWLRRRRQQPQVDARMAAWQESFEASNPSGPPLTDADVTAFQAWLGDLSLPAADLLPAPEKAIAAGGTRLGGPAWLQDGEAWPRDGDGAPLELAAQIDFADLPALPDFPSSGLLQLFIGRDDLYGADFDDPARGSARAIWRGDALEHGALHPPPPLKFHAAHGGAQAESSPFSNADVRARGLPLSARAAVRAPDPSDWRIAERFEGQMRRPGFDRIEALLDADLTTARHHVGGHPAFTQHDFRQAGHYDDYDRTLLRLTSDDSLMWGDVGEAAFLIRRSDLLARDFSSVAFYWDCS